MLERFTYTNSQGETLTFGTDGLFVNENDLRDFAWAVNKRNEKISGFTKGVVAKTIPVILACATELEGLQMRNRLFEVFEKDVLSKQYGRLQIGEYYLRCYITGSKKTEYLIHKNYMVVDLTVQTDLPEWVRETVTYHDFTDEGTQTFLDFPHDYPFDFKNGGINANTVNTALIPCNFKMVITGEVTYPTLFVSNHRYAVNVPLNAGEQLIIDSATKTITLKTINGETVNCFNERYRDSYIFEKIPTGDVVLTTTDKIKVTLTLYEERSEPKWT